VTFLQADPNVTRRGFLVREYFEVIAIADLLARVDVDPDRHARQKMMPMVPQPSRSAPTDATARNSYELKMRAIGKLRCEKP